MKLVYLACPYTHKEPQVQQRRVNVASAITGWLMTKGHAVFSPITHGHAIVPFVDPQVSSDHQFWMKQCIPILRMSDILAVVPLPGWRDSKGMAQEIELAKAAHIPISYLRPSMSIAFNALIADYFAGLEVLDFDLTHHNPKDFP